MLFWQNKKDHARKKPEEEGEEMNIPDIRPEFMSGLAYCSCYTSTTGKPVGKCPQWVQHGSKQYWCQIGSGVQNGGNGGKMCTPYYRELLEALQRQKKLLEMAEKMIGGK